MSIRNEEAEAKHIYVAICEKLTAEAIRLIDGNPNLLHASFSSGGWLHHACSTGNTVLAVELMNRGIGVNTAFGRYANTPLGSAVWSGSTDLVELLLKRGANPNQSRELIRACAKGNLEIVKLLVEHGADIHRVFGEKKEPRINALSHAIAYGHDEIAEYLTSQGATGAPG